MTSTDRRVTTFFFSNRVATLSGRVIGPRLIPPCQGIIRAGRYGAVSIRHAVQLLIDVCIGIETTIVPGGMLFLTEEHGDSEYGGV